MYEYILKLRASLSKYYSIAYIELTCMASYLTLVMYFLHILRSDRRRQEPGSAFRLHARVHIAVHLHSTLAPAWVSLCIIVAGASLGLGETPV